MSTLEEIVYSSDKKPEIINRNSNFVVVSYYWGYNNLNANLSRPCVSFYEDVLTKMQNIIINSVLSTNIALIDSPDFSETMSNLPIMRSLIAKKTKSYLGMINEDLGISNMDPQRFQKALSKLERSKENGKTPVDYEYKDDFIVEKIFNIALKEMISANKNLIKELAKITKKMKFIEVGFKMLKNKTTKDDIDNDKIKNRIIELTNAKIRIREQIKANLKIKKDYYFDFSGSYKSRKSNTPLSKQSLKYEKMSIYDILIKELRYLNPITYGKMADRWEQYCKESNCNYLAIDYPQFAVPGGYQMAINAKPLFIKRALELCYPRSVVYIDTDMLVRKYPSIFDMTDVDHMARGWHIDPRASYKSFPYEDEKGEMKQSIMFDPYTYETSGGTMFFSQSDESKGLINAWILESSKQYQKGKADDRILSLIFNTNKLLLSMKIIQLPVEYLWLSLDYDERNLENIYDYNFADMKSSIFFEHPECLTSEETASGAGASSDRMPKFYGFLEDIHPVSETFFEYITFPNKEMSDAFKDYHTYMGGVTYVLDGNDELIAKELVDPDDPENNAQPMYIVKYDEKFGNKKYPGESDYTYTDISNINIKRAKQMNLNFLGDLMNDEYVEITDVFKEKESEIISLIIRLLIDGKNVIYNPSLKNGYNKLYYDFLRENINGIYKSLEFVFHPKTTNLTKAELLEFNSIFRPRMETNQVMLFRSGNRILIDLLSLFVSFDELSNYINYGAYQFISRIRVGLIIPPKQIDLDSIINTSKSFAQNSQSLNPYSMPNLSNTVQHSLPLSRSRAKRLSISRNKKQSLSHRRSGSHSGKQSRSRTKGPSKSRSGKQSRSRTKGPSKSLSKRRSKRVFKTIDGNNGLDYDKYQNGLNLLYSNNSRSKHRRSIKPRSIAMDGKKRSRKNNKTNDVLVISNICCETFPCQHEVILNGKKILLTQKQIRKLLVDNNRKVPRHFIQ